MPLVLLFLMLYGPADDMRRVNQSRSQFYARLSTVPIDLAMQSTIAGRGSVRAILVDRTLTITGEFADLKTPATFAKLHVGPNKGIRGPAIFDLKVTTGTDGTISGTLDLTEEQTRDLKGGRFYIQLHSEKAPEGNLWGWLLPEERR
jgi:hypothetical protein